MRRALVAAVAALALTACGGSNESGIKTENVGSDGMFGESRVTLTDGRTVLCVTYDRGVSCEWGRAR